MHRQHPWGIQANKESNLSPSLPPLKISPKVLHLSPIFVPVLMRRLSVFATLVNLLDRCHAPLYYMVLVGHRRTGCDLVFFFFSFFFILCAQERLGPGTLA